MFKQIATHRFDPSMCKRCHAAQYFMPMLQILASVVQVVTRLGDRGQQRKNNNPEKETGSQRAWCPRSCDGITAKAGMCETFCSQKCEGGGIAQASAMVQQTKGKNQLQTQKWLEPKFLLNTCHGEQVDFTPRQTGFIWSKIWFSAPLLPSWIPVNEPYPLKPRFLFPSLSQHQIQ